jgi:hypothetical protein
MLKRRVSSTGCSHVAEGRHDKAQILVAAAIAGTIIVGSATETESLS